MAFAVIAFRLLVTIGCLLGLAADVGIIAIQFLKIKIPVEGTTVLGVLFLGCVCTVAGWIAGVARRVRLREQGAFFVIGIAGLLMPLIFAVMGTLFLFYAFATEDWSH